MFPATAFAIGTAGDTEWPQGAAIEVQLRLAASLADKGDPKITGYLKITNLRATTLTIQKPTNRLVLAFVVFDSLGNPVAPQFRGKADPFFQTISLAPHATYIHHFYGLDFVTGSAWLSYDLARGQLYHVVAIYRAAGPHGPGFASQETKLQIPI